MNWEFFIANRYLRSKRRTGFISLITYISAGGVMTGVAALVIVLSVANGFETEVRQRIIGADAHIRLTLFHEEPFKEWGRIREQVLGMPNVTGASPYISGKGMLRRGKAIEGAFIQGVDERTVGTVGDLPRNIVAGSLRLEPLDGGGGAAAPTTNGKAFEAGGFFKPPAPDIPGIILGRQLSFRLEATVGDTVVAFSPAALSGLFAAPTLTRLVVTGIFETGIFEYDDNFCYISISEAQELFQMDSAVTGLEIKLDHPDRAPLAKARLEDDLGYPYYARTWHDMHRTLFRWMKLEKWLYTILLSLIIVVAAFNIVSSQIMIVLEKRREIGILKAMGATRDEIMRIFLYEGLIIGIFGTMLGLVLGWGLCQAQKTYQFFSLPGDVYFLNALPVDMQWLDFVVIALVSLMLTLLASLYPARRAGSLDPVETIRYE